MRKPGKKKTSSNLLKSAKHTPNCRDECRSRVTMGFSDSGQISPRRQFWKWLGNVQEIGANIKVHSKQAYHDWAISRAKPVLQDQSRNARIGWPSASVSTRPPRAYPSHHNNSPISPKPFSGPPERLCSPHSLFSTPEHHGSQQKVGDFWLNFSWHVS